MKQIVLKKMSFILIAFLIILPSFSCLTMEANGVDLPSVFDPRKTTPAMVSAVKMQPNDTCWSYGTVAALESYELKNKGTTEIYSENYLNYILASNAFGSEPNIHAYNRILGTGGNAALAANTFANWNGPVLEQQFPVSVSGTITPERLDITPALHVQGYNYFAPLTGVFGAGINENNRITKVNNIKNAVYNNGAATYNVQINDVYYDSVNNSQYRPSDKAMASNHVVTIVGWDDNFPVSKFSTPPPGPGAFIVKNSWGTGWGDGGYYYSSYYDYYLYESSVISFNLVEPIDNYYKNYSLTEVMAIGAQQIMPAATSPIYFANVFSRDITDNEYIDAVGFFTLNNTPYEIYINPNGESLEPSELKFIQSGVVSTGGYVTVPLDAKQYLGVSKKFAVVVKMTPGSSVIPVEAKRHGPNIVVNSGESFYTTNMNSGWTDNVREGNFIIRAYTNLDNELPKDVKITALVSPNYSGGSVSGGGVFPNGSSVTLNAIADSGYEFDGWYRAEDKVSDCESYTFDAYADAVYEARFLPIPAEFKMIDLHISGIQKAGEPLTFTAETQGGRNPVKYAFYILGDGKIYYKGVYPDTNSFSFTPEKAGEYYIRVYAIDSRLEKVAFDKKFIID